MAKQLQWWENEENYHKKHKKQDWSWEEDEYQGIYDYELSKQIARTDDKPKNNWEEYNKTGVWRGYDYYRASQVDYGYIEKMANAFGAKFNINVVAGNEWSSDPIKKTLTYEPMSLMQYSKARIIALLLHEVGHIKYTEVPKDADSRFILAYKTLAREVFNVFEDFRIDKIMSKAYEGAEDVYEANEPVIKEMAEKYEHQAERLNKMVQHYCKEVLQNQTLDEVEKTKRLVKLEGMINKKENLMNYLSAILCTGYGQPVKPTGRIKPMVDKTAPYTKEAEKCKTSAELLTMLDKHVYPVIEELLKELTDSMNEVENLFGKVIAKIVAEGVKQWFVNEGNGKSPDEEGMPLRMEGSKGAGRNHIPKEWADGDYYKIKDSVNTAIKELVRKLNFLRKEELVPKYVHHQRRGKIHLKSLYKYRLGNFRLFKKKEEAIDTVRSFAFSLVLDRSGSMSGPKIVHSTRALIMLSEVFEKMKIPYDIQLFGSSCTIIKKFGEKYDENMKKRIGGVASGHDLDGSTDIYTVFQDGLDLAKQPEKNKIMVIISDGCIGGGIEETHRDWMDKEVKKGVKFMGVGLDGDQEVIDLCYGQGFSTDNPHLLPNLFADMLKQLIFSKKKKQPIQTPTK